MDRKGKKETGVSQSSVRAPNNLELPTFHHLYARDQEQLLSLWRTSQIQTIADTDAGVVRKRIEDGSQVLALGKKLTWHYKTRGGQ